ncbi:MAG: hypothetical protein QXV17_09765 [Candidatus Micrarchaeaceae archaeon]
MVRKTRYEREGLAPYLGTRGEFIATVSRFGTKTGWNGEMIKTVLLTNVKRDGKLVTFGLWSAKGFLG